MVPVPLAAVVEPLLDDLVPLVAAGPAPEWHDTAANVRAAKTTNPITAVAKAACGNLDRLVITFSFRPSFGALPTDSPTVGGLVSPRTRTPVPRPNSDVRPDAFSSWFPTSPRSRPRRL